MQPAHNSMITEEHPEECPSLIRKDQLKTTLKAKWNMLAHEARKCYLPQTSVEERAMVQFPLKGYAL